MKIKITDIKFIINNEEYYISQLNNQQIDCLHTVFNSTCANIVQCTDIKILFPINNIPYNICELRPNQLFMFSVLFKRIKNGNLIAKNTIIINEITLTESEKAVIRSMTRNSMSITKVAKDLKIDRNTVYRSIKKIKEKTNLDAQNFEHLNSLIFLL